MGEYQKVKEAYDAIANKYFDYASVPYGILETQLFTAGLGDCAGLTVLDLGGGNGLRARQAIDNGAKIVDVVDLSQEMMNVGKEIEASLGRKQINWHQGDISQPLDHLSLGSYDLVMANWVFDHAASVQVLESMWQNVVSHLKPAGLFVGVRMGDMHAPAILSGKYGSTLKEFESIPGGIRYHVVLHSNPPMEFEATSMETSYTGSTEMHIRYGLENVETVAPEDMEIVKSDHEFWKDFLDRPSMAVVKARKRSD
jgi:SAM-dependent methyltransferase